MRRPLIKPFRSDPMGIRAAQFGPGHDMELWARETLVIYYERPDEPSLKIAHNRGVEG